MDLFWVGRWMERFLMQGEGLGIFMRIVKVEEFEVDGMLGVPEGEGGDIVGRGLVEIESHGHE
jgi:hypothetical protein